jgi:hypothetical protein
MAALSAWPAREQHDKHAHEIWSAGSPAIPKCPRTIESK